MSLHNTKVLWIPAHESAGSVSMRRYWNALEEAIHPMDSYQIRSAIRPDSESRLTGWKRSAEKFLQRKLGYPITIRRKFDESIVHILDHSWSDMFRHVPPQAARVVTVHDLIPLRFPGELTPSQLGRFRSWVSYIASTDAVIADSEYTKQEIIEFLKIPEDSIFVVPCGVALPAPEPATSGWISEKFLSLASSEDSFKIGSIGSTIERKNLAIFPEALREFIKTSSRKPVLVRAGARLPEHLASEIRSIAGSDSLIELGKIKDEELGEFFQNVDVVAVPSLYEGFGLPLIEAMAWKVPVISANQSSLPEVGGDCAIYFDPNSPTEFGQRLAELAEEGLPANWLDRAYERAGSYSWRSALEKIHEVYDIASARRDLRMGS